ncbi:erg24, C-14 sterol reductase [Rhizina undulata]
MTKVKSSTTQNGGHGYEFGGPLGALGVTLGTPFLTYLLYFACNESGCPSSSFLTAPLETFKHELWPGWDGFFSLRIAALYAVYYLGLVAMQFALPGKVHEGGLLADGTRLKYKLNGFATLVSVVLYCAAMTVKDGLSWSLWGFIWTNYLQLITAALLFSTLLAFFVYLQSHLTPTLLAAGGNSGNYLYDWFIGRPLNPRIGSLDLKCFSELRPGLILWPILNFAFLSRQYMSHGRVTDSMILVNVFQFWYVFDSLWNEPAVLTTMDITTDGFGFMLSFGDLVWVPFVYSLQARYLALYPVDLGGLGLAGVLAIQALGYYIFRGANGEKNAFRTNPNDPALKHLKYIETKSGSRLLITGWWGIARHINYFGDWIMAWAWCLPTGFGTLITYFYVVYFGVLLIHRDRRDEAKCVAKYGEDWEKYRKLVPSRIIPGIY